MLYIIKILAEVWARMLVVDFGYEVIFKRNSKHEGHVQEK